ncbi:uncharacterized protein LOC130810652 [Amaranthus tricolor]|uniref:uncharacterized protein LOC130810652 n=1 Tax=Amaranthus tricolor TaxID=29722 RepID=UPI002590E410|nr:uncharacterized protein LOC130810652 [Amaranthus tricolor]XP_057532778.1 uncharacterized protein LOC130810652 [Amaranthus tricolor]
MKSKGDGNVSNISQGLASSTGENKTNQNLRDGEVSIVSSERVHSTLQTLIRSDLSSDTGQRFNGKRKVVDSVIVEHNKVIKTDSSSSKESGEVIQLSSVDSTDPIHCQSVNNEKKPYVSQSNESKVGQDRESPMITKSSDSIAASLPSSRHCNVDLNEGTEAKGAISVVAKVGVPMGLPKKPLQFGGELGWKRSSTASAFHPTSLKTPEREKETCNHRGIDLNVVATMDSEHPVDETPMGVVTSNPPARFLLDLNSRSENDETYHKPVASSFDLNDNLVTEDACRNTYQCSEILQLPRKSVAADTRTVSGGNTITPSIFDPRRPPSYLVDLNSIRNLGHVQQQPYLVATTPTAEQVQMMVPSALYIGKINNIGPTFYPPGVLPHFNTQHGAAVIPQIPVSVLQTYSGPVHFIEGPQGLNLNTYPNMRPAFFPNRSIPFVENGSRGIGNADLLIPLGNGLFETRERPAEQVILSASQINYRQMSSWN